MKSKTKKRLNYNRFRELLLLVAKMLTIALAKVNYRAIDEKNPKPEKTFRWRKNGDDIFAKCMTLTCQLEEAERNKKKAKSLKSKPSEKGGQGVYS